MTYYNAEGVEITKEEYDALIENASAEEKAALEAAVFTRTYEVNTDEIIVENNKGTELPATGGIGTTIFYVLGGILLVGAAVLLITKKRMSAQG